MNFTRALAGEWERRGITVNAIAPGFLPSNMTRGLLNKLGADSVAAEVSLRRIGDSEDLKGRSHCSHRMPASTSRGKSFAVDGGATAAL